MLINKKVTVVYHDGPKDGCEEEAVAEGGQLAQFINHVSGGENGSVVTRQYLCCRLEESPSGETTAHYFYLGD